MSKPHSSSTAPVLTDHRQSPNTLVPWSSVLPLYRKFIFIGLKIHWTERRRCHLVLSWASHLKVFLVCPSSELLFNRGKVKAARQTASKMHTRSGRRSISFHSRLARRPKRSFLLPRDGQFNTLVFIYCQESVMDGATALEAFTNCLRSFSLIRVTLEPYEKVLAYHKFSLPLAFLQVMIRVPQVHLHWSGAKYIAVIAAQRSTFTHNIFLKF